MTNHDETFTTERGAAALLGISRRALQDWRYRGNGPTFHRLTPRLIRYRVCDVMAWATARRFESTAQYDNPTDSVTSGGRHE